jgi:hypothetical protein
VKHSGKRIFPVAIGMPAEENSIHESDQKDDEKENECGIEIGVKFFCGKKGLSDHIDLKNECENQKSEREVQS